MRTYQRTSAMTVTVTIVALLALVFIGWRLASRRQSLPCPVWLRWLVELDNPFTKTNRALEILSHLDLHPGMSVLDMGCGPGRLTLPAAAQVGSEGLVLAVDIQAGMLSRVKEKAARAGLNTIQTLQAGAGDGKLGNSRFDRALLVTVLGEIPDCETALRELYTALKPGGLLSVTEVIFDPHFQRQTTVRNIAQRCGFREQALFGNRIAYTLLFRKQPGIPEDPATRQNL
ncbi:MAG: class I SAM-dependent methyltransferase [Pseudomonadales bacterium]|nr:class I SAM-dependent methyltransferase [Pseudomonadales bacterium]